MKMHTSASASDLIRDHLCVNRHNLSLICIITVLLCVFPFCRAPLCFAGEEAFINSDTLEYDTETSTYTAKGNVRIKKADVLIEAEEAHYAEKTGDITATGSVRYEDADVLMEAESVELNLEAKTGTLYNGSILYKKDNYHITGTEIEKKGELHYVSPKATLTTCDGPVPAWCFTGKEVDAFIGEALKAKHVAFRIKNIPIFYTPYLIAPITTERKTGFLIPLIGYSESRGVHLNLPFYLVLSENRDMTFVFETYSTRGTGEGMEYRYIEPSGAEGRWWAYHLRDSDLNKDYFEIKALHEQRSPEKIGGFLSINYINEDDYYREFNPSLEVSTNRFLESSGEISLPFSSSRLFLLSQYWIDLKENSTDPAQRLPELGFVLRPSPAGPFMVSADLTLSNFWSDEEVHGQRLDIFPKVMHSFGDEAVVTQTLGFRETAYSLQRTEDDAHPHRESLFYSIRADTRLNKHYQSLTHIVEPSLAYTLITDPEDRLPLFDSTELFRKTSLIEFSLLNRFINDDGELFVVRATQGLDADQGNRPFQPLKLEIGIRKPFSLKLEADYDVNSGTIDTVNSDLSVHILNTSFSVAQRYDNENDITYYNTALAIHPFSPLYLEWRVWYDQEEKEVREFSTDLTYLSQCWGIHLQYVKRPDDYSIMVMFQLKGLMKELKMI